MEQLRWTCIVCLLLGCSLIACNRSKSIVPAEEFDSQLSVRISRDNVDANIVESGETVLMTGNLRLPDTFNYRKRVQLVATFVRDKIGLPVVAKSIPIDLLRTSDGNWSFEASVQFPPSKGEYQLFIDGISGAKETPTDLRITVR